MSLHCFFDSGDREFADGGVDAVGSEDEAEEKTFNEITSDTADQRADDDRAEPDDADGIDDIHVVGWLRQNLQEVRHLLPALRTSAGCVAGEIVVAVFAEGMHRGQVSNHISRMHESKTACPIQCHEYEKDDFFKLGRIDPAMKPDN